MKKPLVASWLLLFSFALNPRCQEPRPVASPTATQAPPRATPIATQEKHEEQEQDVVRITTNLVRVDVVVTKEGRQVTDLKPEDFEILEDGRAQPITNFAYVSAANRPQNTGSAGVPPAGNTGTGNTGTGNTGTGNTGTVVDPPTGNPPGVHFQQEVKRTVAIVVDDLGMSFQSMSNLRPYLLKFLTDNLQPNDLIAVIRTGGEVGALQQFTADPRVLANAIADLKWNPCSRVGASVLAPERSLITVYPPEGQLRGRLPSDRSPGSNQVERSLTSNESNPCSIGSSVAYSINALRFILRGMRDLPGRKSMMIISDNLPMERQETTPVDFGFKRPVRENANLIDVWTQSTSYTDGLHGLAELAIRASVVIYGITSERLQTTGPQPADEISFPPPGAKTRPDQQDALTKLMRNRSTELRRNSDGAEILAMETGGFVVRNKNDFGLEQVFEDQSGYYLIGYRPGSTTFNRQFHTIQARVKRHGLAVRTRAGFYGVTEEEARAGQPSNRDRMNRALTSPFGANDMALRLTTFFANDPARGSLLRLFLALDPNDLTFRDEPDGTHTARLELSSVLFSENGSVARRQDQNAILRLRGKPYERAIREGVVYGYDLPLKQAGAFQLRVAIRDTSSQRIAAAGQFIHVPDLNNGQLALSDILLRAETQNPRQLAGIPASTPNSSKQGAQADNDDDLRNSLVMRRFHQGTSLVFGYTIYKASLNKTTRLPQLTTRTLVFRNSVKVYNSDPLAVETKGQSDLQRISTGARLQLGPALTPGEYVLQIVVEDKLTKRTATQWTQFEVVE